MKYALVLITAVLVSGCGGDDIGEEAGQSFLDEAKEAITTTSTTSTTTTTTTTPSSTTTSTLVPPSGVCSRLSGDSGSWGSEIVETMDGQVRDYFDSTGAERVPPEVVDQVWAEGYAEVVEGCPQAEAVFLDMTGLNGHALPH